MAPNLTPTKECCATCRPPIANYQDVYGTAPTPPAPKEVLYSKTTSYTPPAPKEVLCSMPAFSHFLHPRSWATCHRLTYLLHPRKCCATCRPPTHVLHPRRSCAICKPPTDFCTQGGLVQLANFLHISCSQGGLVQHASLLHTFICFVH